jgi:hypothetical protein
LQLQCLEAREEELSSDMVILEELSVILQVCAKLDKMVKCACGELRGELCSAVESQEELVKLEFMPLHLRASHRAAGNRGVYPHNGARRILVSRACAEEIIDVDGEWCHRVASEKNR